MIQRIQTVYLALAFFALSLLFLFPIVQFSSAKNFLSSSEKIPAGFSGASGGFSNPSLNYKIFAFEETADIPSTPLKPDYSSLFLPNTVAIAVAMLFLLACIFLFNNRKKQLAVCWSAVVIILLCAVLIYLKVKPSELPTEGRQLGAGSFAVSAALIFTIFAGNGIRKDEELVRSADRLR